MADHTIRGYFHSVYRLAQQAAEALALFGVIQSWFKTGTWAKDFNNAFTNEDLSRIIASACRRTSIVATHILCDSGKPGTCNIFRLVQRMGLPPSEKRAIRLRLKLIAGGEMGSNLPRTF